MQYERLARKIESAKGLSDEEKKVIIDSLNYTLRRYAVMINSIVSLLKLIGSKKQIEQFRSIVSKAEKNVERGKKALSSTDAKALEEIFSSLRKESAARMLWHLKNGDYTFIKMLNDSVNKIDVEEIEKLEKFLKKTN